jgi:hypothetical protein
VRAVRLPSRTARVLPWKPTHMSENERARHLTSYDDQLAELRRYL